MSARTIMLVAGEASGDAHGAALCEGLKRLEPDCRLIGMGGAKMAAAGMDVLVDVTAAAVVGGSEALTRLPLMYRAFRRLQSILRQPERPAALVLIDFPEFNLRLARTARQSGVPVVYFIPPQLWAWRAGRIRAIRQRVSLVLAVFPFEAALYRAAGVSVAFVGHPLLDALARAPDRASARGELGLSDGDTVIGLLPGSRREEVARTLPVMLEAIERVARQRPHIRVVLGQAPTIDRLVLARYLARVPDREVVTGRAHAVMRASDLLLVTSGTATLEAALLGAPMIVCYRVSRATAVMARALLRVPWISLANLTLGRAVVPELYQRHVTGERLGDEIFRLLGDPAALEAQRRAFRELAGRLGEAGVGERAARLVLREAGVRG